MENTTVLHSERPHHDARRKGRGQTILETLALAFQSSSKREKN